MNVWRHAYRAGSSCRWAVFSDNVRERGVVSTLSLGLECRFLEDVCLNYVCLAAFMWGWALMRLVGRGRGVWEVCPARRIMFINELSHPERQKRRN